jgi:hypothetical protein
MAELRATPFVMHGARDAIAGGLTHVEQQVKSIEQAVVENPGLAFDLAKTLVESVCRAVLGERNITFSEDDDLPKLFKMASLHLPFLPPSASGEAGVRDSLKRTLGGLSTAIQGICELRNQCGFASHGSGALRHRWSRCKRCWPPRPRTPSSASFTVFTGKTGRRRSRRGRCTRTTRHSTIQWTTPTA